MPSFSKADAKVSTFFQTNKLFRKFFSVQLPLFIPSCPTSISSNDTPFYLYIRTRKNGDFVEIEIPATEQSSLWIYLLRKPKKYRKEYQLLHFFRIFVPHCAPLVLEKSIVGAPCWCLRTYNNHISNSINN